jgi:hypothetical protein
VSEKKLVHTQSSWHHGQLLHITKITYKLWSLTVCPSLLQPSMDPKNTKQKTNHERSSGEETASSRTTTPGQYLPGEVLQMIFRRLSFFDLIRCMRVCKTWSAYLPGDDSILHEALFLKSRSPVLSHSLGLTVYFTIIATKSRYAAFPPPIYELRAHVQNCYYPGEDRLTYHPIVKYLHQYFDFFNEHAESVKVQGQPYRTVRTLRFKLLEELEQESKNGQGKGSGQWNDMLICIPAIETANIEFHWKNHLTSGGVLRNGHNKYISRRIASNDKGVTLRDLADEVQNELSSGEFVKHFFL